MQQTDEIVTKKFSRVFFFGCERKFNRSHPRQDEIMDDARDEFESWCIWCASIIDRVRMPTSLSRRYLLRFRRVVSVITTYEEVVVSIGIRQWRDYLMVVLPRKCLSTVLFDDVHKSLDSTLTFSITRRANDTGPTTVCWGGSWWTQWYHVNVHRH